MKESVLGETSKTAMKEEKNKETTVEETEVEFKKQVGFAERQQLGQPYVRNIFFARVVFLIATLCLLHRMKTVSAVVTTEDATEITVEERADSCIDDQLPKGKAYNGPIEVNITHEEDQGLLVEILTQHLSIRTIQAQDISDYEALFTDEEVMKTYGTGKAKKPGEITKRIVDSWIPRWKSGDPYSALAIHTHEGEFVGHIVMGYGDAMNYDGSNNKTKDGYSELAYILAKAQWNKGHGKEAAAGVVKGLTPKLIQGGYKVGTICNGAVHYLPLRWVTATCRIDRNDQNEFVNAASLKILTGLAFTLKGKGEKYGHERGFFALKMQDNNRVQTSLA